MATEHWNMFMHKKLINEANSCIGKTRSYLCYFHRINTVKSVTRFVLLLKKERAGKVVVS